MPNYVVRVELKGNPTSSQYDELHLHMQDLGLSRLDLISPDEGHRMPIGTYSGSSEYELETLARYVRASARLVENNIMVFVAETERAVYFTS